MENQESNVKGKPLVEWGDEPVLINMCSPIGSAYNWAQKVVRSIHMAILFIITLAGALAKGVTAFSPTLSFKSALREPSLSISASVNHGETKAVIVGGGPAGALMAIYLAQDPGFKVDLFEKLEEDKISGPTIRSWNVVLFKRGLAAMENAGVDIHAEVKITST